MLLLFLFLDLRHIALLVTSLVVASLSLVTIRTVPQSNRQRMSLVENPAGESAFTSDFCGFLVAQYLVFCVKELCISLCPFVPFLLTIVLSVPLCDVPCLPLRYLQTVFTSTRSMSLRIGILIMRTPSAQY